VGGLSIVTTGTPVFSSCNQTNCTERICAILGTQVSLDYGIAFINSISMIEGPHPHRTEFSKVENDNQCTPLIQCSRISQETYCNNLNELTFEISTPTAITIRNVSLESAGTYVVTATITEPSGVSRQLRKTIIGEC
jgi:hypothetical protein